MNLNGRYVPSQNGCDINSGLSNDYTQINMLLEAHYPFQAHRP